MRQTLKKNFFFLYINLATVCLLLVGMELAGQIGFYIFNGHFVYQHRSSHQEIFERHPYLVGQLKKNTTTTLKDKTITGTPLATRWTGAPTDDQDLVRIAVLGGSTTFGTRVSDEHSWPALLQSQLGDSYAVINYGVPGYSTVEAIIQMALLVPEKQPHVVIFYEGWNDIRNYHDPAFSPDYYSHGMKQFQNLGLEESFAPSFFREARDISALFWLAGILDTVLFGETPSVPPVHAHDTPDPFVDGMYLRNLKTLKVLTDQIHARSFFVPQVLNDAAFSGKQQARKWSPFIRDDAMPELLTRFNAIMDEACRSQDVNCSVIHQVQTEDWEPSDFKDDGHFSRRGGRRFAAILVTHIRRHWLQAISLLRQGRETEAFAVLDEAIAEQPDVELNHRNLAEALFRVGRVDEAVAALDRAIEIAPTAFHAYMVRAFVSVYQADSCNRVEADLAKAREVAIPAPEKQNMEAILLALHVSTACPELYDGARALDLAHEAAEHDQRYEETLGIAYYRHGEYEQARKTLLTSAEAERLSVYGSFFLAMTRWKLDERPEARSAYDTAVERMEQSWPRSPGFNRIKAEASQVLGLR